MVQRGLFHAQAARAVLFVYESSNFCNSAISVAGVCVDYVFLATICSFDFKISHQCAYFFFLLQ